MSSEDVTAAAPAPRPGGPHPAATRVQAVLVAILLVAFVVQIALAGLGAFRGAEASRVEDSFWEPHRMLGFTMAGLTVFVLLSALVARTGRRDVVLAIVLVVLTAALQPALAELADDGAWIGALHALDGLAIGGVAGVLLRVTRGHLTGTGAPR